MDKNYKGTPSSPGVYQIRNKTNGKLYIGQTSRFNRRAKQHENDLKRGEHRNKRLQNSWNLHGSESFEFEVLHVVVDKEQRNAVEQELLTKHFGDDCYNLRSDVTEPPSTWSHNPEETRRKMSEAKKGRTHSEETKRKMSEWQKGNPKNQTFSVETRRKMSESQKCRPPASEETRKKIAASKLGKPRPEHVLQKLREANLGRKLSEEHKQKLSESSAMRGKKLSAEHMEKLREANRLRWEMRRMEKEEISQLFLDDKTETSDSE